jgi:phage RecT family recombinase
MSNAGPPPVARSNAVVPAEQRQNVAMQNYQTVAETLRANNGADAKAIRGMFNGDKRMMDRFLSVCFSLLAADNDLLTRATPMSIVEAIKKGASLGLEPMTEDAAIVLYGDKAQLLPMYRGYLKRIRRSGLFAGVDAAMVYENDEFSYGTSERGTSFSHVPAQKRTDADGNVLQERGGYRGAYAYALTREGFCFFRYMDLDELNYVRDTWGNKRSNSGRPLPWTTSYDQMCLKTVLRRLAKILPQEAVGVELLELERQNDEAIERSVAAAVKTEVSEIQRMALLSVNPTSDVPGQPPEPEAGDAPVPEPAPEGAPEPVGSDQPDANVQAAMTGHLHSTEPGWKLQPRTCPACANLARPNL